MIRAEARWELYFEVQTPTLKGGVGNLNRMVNLINRSETIKHFVNFDNPELRHVA